MSTKKTVNPDFIKTFASYLFLQKQLHDFSITEFTAIVLSYYLLLYFLFI